MDIQAYMDERVVAVDRLLDALLPAAESPPQSLHAAMRHLVFPGGKRLRPAFASAAAEALGASPNAALPMAVAVELIHTYSLVHDDLPCMDDDDERRGRPSVHVAYGEAVAVLAGDALQALAFEALSGAAREASREPFDEPSRVLAALRELADASGSRNLVGGQVDDLVFDPENRDSGAIESVHRRKSAALIAASIAGGAVLAGAEPGVVDELRRFGFEVGIAFQIADDVLDEGEDDPCSLVRALGIDRSRERAEALLTDALGRLDSMGERAEPLRDLARFAVRRHG